MTKIPEKLTLKALQEYTQKRCAENGWDKNHYLETFLLFSEEVGELAKAIRTSSKLMIEEGKEGTYNQEKDSIGSELTDILSYLLEIANRFDIDLETAFREKEAINSERKWK